MSDPASLDHSGALPRLLYLADVPVESTYHGSALIYRLLSSYPRDRLLIAEPDACASSERLRLPEVNYRSLSLGIGRLLHSRLAPYYGAAVLLRSTGWWTKVRRAAVAFKPEAVLTVVHGYSWLSAAEYARRARLPLHLVLHDVWTPPACDLGPIRVRAEGLFARYFHFASSRLCVSPAMRDRYQQQYGVATELLYPSRAQDALVASQPAERSSKRFKVAYAGTLTHPGYAAGLVRLAAALEPLGGSLMIYGPVEERRATKFSLRRSNVSFHGLLPSHELILRLRKEADLLFLPMSFSAEHRVQMETCFPSKLTDYTAVGLPILIHGPEYCSAVRWARENVGAAEVVTTDRVDEVRSALAALERESDRRRRLAAGALRAGQECFSFQPAEQLFASALLRPPQRVEANFL